MSTHPDILENVERIANLLSQISEQIDDGNLIELMKMELQINLNDKLSKEFRKQLLEKIDKLNQSVFSK